MPLTKNKSYSIHPCDHLQNQTDWVDIKEDEVTFSFHWSPWQRLLGRTEVFLVSHDVQTKKRRAYRAMVNYQATELKLCDKTSPNKPVYAKCHFDKRGGQVTLAKTSFPKSAKYYFELAQNMGPFLETDYFTLDQKDREVYVEGTVGLIPCYNVEKYCKKVIEEAAERVEKLIVIDDGSTDQTKSIVRDLAQKYPDTIIFLDNETNQGKGFCLLQGFKYASDHLTYKALVALDSDAQHDPVDISRLAEAIFEGENFVIGTRTFLQMPLRSKVANIFISMLLKFVFPHAPKETQSGYRAFDPELVKELAHHIKGGRYEMEFDCLLYALMQKKFIRGLPISTIYVDNNKSSKFDVFIDSYRILKVLLRYAFEKPKS